MRVAYWSSGVSPRPGRRVPPSPLVELRSSSVAAVGAADAQNPFVDISKLYKDWQQFDNNMWGPEIDPHWITRDAPLRSA